MGSIYEYLFAAIIIVTMLVASTTIVTTLSAPTISESEKVNLKVASEKIITQLLLDPGTPYEWGIENTSPDQLSVFGLAKYGSTSRQAYCLDPNKVVRLTSAAQLPQVPSNTYVPVERVLELTNLDHDYGFTLDLNPTLNVKSTRIVDASNPTHYQYTVVVTSGRNNMPIMGAQVNGALYYLIGPTEIGKVSSSSVLITQSDGSCVVDFGPVSVYNGSNEAVLVIVVDYYGIHFAKAFSTDPASPVATTSIIGTQIIQTNPPYSIQSSDTVIEIIGVRRGQTHAILDFDIAVNTTNPSDVTLADFPEQSMIAILATSNGKLFCALQDFSLSYRSIPEVRSTGFAYSVERAVFIRTTSYTATLYLWRMSW